MTIVNQVDRVPGQTRNQTSKQTAPGRADGDMRGWRSVLGLAFFCLLAARPPLAVCADSPNPTAVQVSSDYRLQPGDVINISVWKEHDLQADVLIRPDGGMSFPLVGDIDAKGQTLNEVRVQIVERLKPYIPNAVVTIAIKSIGGNIIYVLGKVTRPGEFPFNHPVDVMQALSLAGGATPYAALNKIVILRRDNHGAERVMRFRYGDIARGRNLEQNVLLESGDTVVVP